MHCQEIDNTNAVHGAVLGAVDGHVVNLQDTICRAQQNRLLLNMQCCAQGRTRGCR
jgi:hypothetical protein